MSKILKRDEFISEVYIPKLEKKEYEELTAINEGLLKNLFGAIKNMFKKDWEGIKGDPGIIKVYKELDDRLKGFSMMKLTKKEECNQIRQELVDFACDWYDMKMNKAKENDTDPKLAKSMNFKNDTLRENIENVDRKIKEVSGEDEQMLRWANILKDDMKIVINRSILEQIKDEEKRQELEEKNKQIEEADKERRQGIEEEMKKMEQEQNKALKQIKEERDRMIANTGARPDTIKEGVLGDKAVQNLCSAFKRYKNDDGANTDAFKSDTVFGFKKLFSDQDYKNTDAFNKTFELLDSFYTALGDTKVMEKFGSTPGQSVHAMCIAINSFIKNCVYGGDDYGNELPLMAKCAVLSDPIVSYNLPLNDKEGDDAGNYFTDIVKVITSGKLKNAEKKVIKLPDDFKKNAETLMNKIRKEADKLKKDSEKNMEEHNKKLDQLQKELKKSNK
jgi:hypothetical protein